jgi:hypothetical protein
VTALSTPGCPEGGRRDGHVAHLDMKQVDQSKAFVHTIFETHHGRLSLQSRCSPVLLAVPAHQVVAEHKEPKKPSRLLISLSQIPLTPQCGVFGSTSFIRCRRAPDGLLFSFLFLLSDQKGIQLLILPDVSAGYPNIFLPVSLAQHPQKIAAGQQMICMVVRI